jgi:signal transduction histidine kinase
MGNFYKEGDAAQFMEVCRNHSHVMPAEGFARLDDSQARLREIALLQQRARSLEHEIQHRTGLERALRAALEDGRSTEEALRVSLKREKEARAEAEASDAFKEMFLAMLGHDLRNPLNTVLTTARLMAIRGELPVESQKRLGRIVSSGERMQRMIGQILDVTHARHATGIVVEAAEQDLVPLVAGIVDEVSTAHPARRIELLSDGPCTAMIDAERFEQVIANLLGNAIAHGDPDEEIRVEIATRETVVSVAVHNHGAPIPPSVIPHLFNPFERDKPEKRSDGLGLGLYISERIVNAHCGTIEVESSAATGTRFEVMLPRR